MTDNERIAKFMGLPISAQITDHIGKHGVMVLGMQYDKSWDWIMPVVKKIRDTSPYTSTDGYHLYEQIRESLLCLNIAAVHRSVVEYLEWFETREGAEE